MQVYNVKPESVAALLNALEAMGVARADVRKNMDFRRDGGATYYPHNFMEHAALKSITVRKVNAFVQ